MKFVIRFFPLFVLFAVTAGSASGQSSQSGQSGQQGAPMSIPAADSVSDSELQIVAKVIDSTQVIQQQIAMEVQVIVEDEGMEFARFQEIMMSRQNPLGSPGIEITESEDQIIQQIQPQLGTIQQQAQQQFVQVLQAEGMNPMRFQQIIQALQNDSDINRRFLEMRGGN